MNIALNIRIIFSHMDLQAKAFLFVKVIENPKILNELMQDSNIFDFQLVSPPMWYRNCRTHHFNLIKKSNMVLRLKMFSEQHVYFAFETCSWEQCCKGNMKCCFINKNDALENSFLKDPLIENFFKFITSLFWAPYVWIF